MLAVLLGFQKDEFPQYYHRRIDEMEHRSRAGLDVIVGAEEQKRGQTASHEGYKTHTRQGLCAQTYASLAAKRRYGQRGQGQEVAQEGKRNGVDSVVVDHTGHQRHQTENDRAEYDAEITLQHFSVFHWIT